MLHGHYWVTIKIKNSSSFNIVDWILSRVEWILHNIPILFINQLYLLEKLVILNEIVIDYYN